MDSLQVLFDKNANTGSLHMGDILGLWDVGRNKIIGFNLISIFFRQAKDKDLKNLLKKGVESILPTQINSIQKILSDKGYNVPTEPNLKKKYDESQPFILPYSTLDDEEIAMTLREVSRLTLSLLAEAIRNATDKDVRKVIKSIKDDDDAGYNTVIKLQVQKNWADFPPYLIPNN